MENKNLIGRYIKAIIDHPNGGVVRAGEYGKIYESPFSNYYRANFDSQKGYSFNSDKIGFDEKYQIMPEGWSPENKEPKSKFEIGNIINIGPGCKASGNYSSNTFVQACSSNEEKILEKIYYSGIWWYKCHKGINWYTEEGMTLHYIKESIPESKFNVGDVVEKENCLVYTDVKNYSYESIKKSNIIDNNNGRNKIVEKCINGKDNSTWWYKLENHGNWYSEDGLTLPTQENKKTMFQEGDVVVCIGTSSGYDGDPDCGGTGWDEGLCFKITSIWGDNDILGSAKDGCGVYNHHVRRASKEECDYWNKKREMYYITEIPKEKSPNELILEEAKIRFPTGVKVKDLNGYGYDTIVNWEEMSSYRAPSPYFSGKDLYIGVSECKGDRRANIYKDGKWSHIIEPIKSIFPSEEEILQKFPIGTKFLDLVGKREFEVGGAEITYYDEEQNIYILLKPNNVNRTARIYSKGTWATIIPSTPSNKYAVGIDPYEQESPLEQWLRETKAKNFSENNLALFINNYSEVSKGYKNFLDDIYRKLEGIDHESKAKILWNKWNNIKPNIIIEKSVENVFNVKQLKERINEIKKREIKIEHQSPLIIKINKQKRKLITI